jgi:hypothetical protein
MPSLYVDYAADLTDYSSDTTLYTEDELEEEYEVDLILDERQIPLKSGKSRTEYFCKWKLPIWRANWLPARNIRGTHLIPAWTKLKAKIDNGKETPFETQELLDMKNTLQKKRHFKRYTKRLEAGKPLKSLSSSAGYHPNTITKDSDNTANANQVSPPETRPTFSRKRKLKPKQLRQKKQKTIDLQHVEADSHDSDDEPMIISLRSRKRDTLSHNPPNLKQRMSVEEALTNFVSLTSPVIAAPHQIQDQGDEPQITNGLGDSDMGAGMDDIDEASIAPQIKDAEPVSLMNVVSPAARQSPTPTVSVAIGESKTIGNETLQESVLIRQLDSQPAQVELDKFITDKPALHRHQSQKIKPLLATKRGPRKEVRTLSHLYNLQKKQSEQRTAPADELILYKATQNGTQLVKSAPRLPMRANTAETPIRTPTTASFESPLQVNSPLSKPEATMSHFIPLVCPFISVSQRCPQQNKCFFYHQILSGTRVASQALFDQAQQESRAKRGSRNEKKFGFLEKPVQCIKGNNGSYCERADEDCWWAHWRPKVWKTCAFFNQSNSCLKSQEQCNYMHWKSDILPAATIGRRDSSTVTSIRDHRNSSSTQDQETPWLLGNDSVLSSAVSVGNGSVQRNDKLPQEIQGTKSSRIEPSHVNSSDIHRHDALNAYRPSEIGRNQQHLTQREASTSRNIRLRREECPAPGIRTSDPRPQRPDLPATNSRLKNQSAAGPQSPVRALPKSPTPLMQSSTFSCITQELEAILEVKGTEKVIQAMFGKTARQACLLEWRGWNGERPLFTQYLRGCNVRIFDDLSAFISAGSGVLLIHASFPLYDCLSLIPEFHRLLNKEIYIFRIGSDPTTNKVICQQMFHEGTAMFLSSAVYEKDPVRAQAILKFLEKNFSSKDGAVRTQLVIREKNVKFKGEDQEELSYFRDLDYEFLKRLTYESEGKPTFEAYQNLLRTYGDLKAEAWLRRASLDLMPALRRLDNREIEDEYDVEWFTQWFIQ